MTDDGTDDGAATPEWIRAKLDIACDAAAEDATPEEEEEEEAAEPYAGRVEYDS